MIVSMFLRMGGGGGKTKNLIINKFKNLGDINDIKNINDIINVDFDI